MAFIEYIKFNLITHKIEKTIAIKFNLASSIDKIKNTNFKKLKDGKIISKIF